MQITKNRAHTRNRSENYVSNYIPIQMVYLTKNINGRYTP